MKYEWRKEDKQLYIPKNKPEIRTIPEMNYVVIHGEGNPNSEEFATCVGALYAVSYGVKMTLKKETIIPGYYDYTVFPLEGEWNLTEEGKQLYQSGKPITELKDYFLFKVMIRQPEFVTKEYVETIKQTVFKKKKNEKIREVSFERSTEIEACQMLHLGSYDTEPSSFIQMENYAEEQGYNRVSKKHTEIYLTDPSKVASEKLKTTIRFTVKKRNAK